MSHFIFMLTHGDRTVGHAAEIVPTLADTGLRYIGFKDVGADPSRQRELTSLAHDAGFEVMLEVVSTTRGRAVFTAWGGRGRGRLGARRHTRRGWGGDPAGWDPLLPVPRPGRRPPECSARDDRGDRGRCRRLTALDHVTGLDLLAYRHPTADPDALIREVVRRSSGPVIVAGSISSIDRVLAVSDAGAWGYTIGSAIFDGLLAGAPSIVDQVRHVLEETASPAWIRRTTPGRRLEACPAERCSPTGCATSCWRKSPVRSCSQGRSCRVKANSPSASRCPVPRYVTRCVRLSRPGTLSVVAVPAAMSPSVGGCHMDSTRH